MVLSCRNLEMSMRGTGARNARRLGDQAQPLPPVSGLVFAYRIHSNEV